MNIYKNFLSKPDCNKLNDTLLSLDFPWFYAPHQVKKKITTDSSYMAHCFYRDNVINSNFYYLIKPILKKLNVDSLINIRANLCLKRKMKNHWHSDFQKMKTHPKNKVAIYYVNTNNGYTEFKNKKIKSEKNKIVIFNGDVKHRAMYQTDTDTRIIINFNYKSN
tara:strand:- start:78 stop:569 length:492 start_codon:yes stop_codon:yes gene_type:complete